MSKSGRGNKIQKTEYLYMEKYLYLIISILVDLIGMASYIIPGAGELTDLLTAPLNMYWIFTMLDQADEGLLAETGDILLTFIGGAEELSPGFDIIPSATISWIYLYYFKN